MHSGALVHQTRSLDSLAQGEAATVARILFDSLRSHCAERGIREGERVIGAASDPESVLVDTPSGAVPCERRYARFVQVTAGNEYPVEGAHGADTPPA